MGLFDSIVDGIGNVINRAGDAIEYGANKVGQWRDNITRVGGRLVDRMPFGIGRFLMDNTPVGDTLRRVDDYVNRGINKGREIARKTRRLGDAVRRRDITDIWNRGREIYDEFDFLQNGGQMNAIYRPPAVRPTPMTEIEKRLKGYPSQSDGSGGFMHDLTRDNLR